MEASATREVVEVVDVDAMATEPTATATAADANADAPATDATATAAAEPAESLYTTDNALVGRMVRKCFSGRPFIGTVVGYDATAALYKVKYADDDTEELSVHELRPVLQAIDAMDVEAEAKAKAKAEEQRPSYAETTAVGSRVLAGEGDEPSPALYDYHAKAWCTTWGELKRLGWTYKSGNYMGSYNGLPSDWCYLRPGAKHKTGVENRDFFYHEKVGRRASLAAAGHGAPPRSVRPHRHLTHQPHASTTSPPASPPNRPRKPRNNQPTRYPPTPPTPLAATRPPDHARVLREAPD